jgi:sec-independent protein translocase protein TatA
MHLLFFNLGGGEIFVILLFILLFFGSKKIPELARGLGKGIREFKDAAGNIQREIQDTTRTIKDEVDIKK